MSKTTVTRKVTTVAPKAPAKASKVASKVAKAAPLATKAPARKVAPASLMSHATLVLLRRSLRRSLKRVEAALAA